MAATRWIDEYDNEDWKAGTNRAYLRELCVYWQREFDYWATETIHSANRLYYENAQFMAASSAEKWKYAKPQQKR